MSYIEVVIDTDHLETDDLITILDKRGFTVLYPGDNDEATEQNETMKDDIYGLYRDFTNWNGNRMSDSSFESALKQFFEKYTDKVVA